MQEFGDPRIGRQRAQRHHRIAVARDLAAHRLVQYVHERALADAGREQRLVANDPDLADIHRHRVAGVGAARDAVEAEPVAAEFQPDDLFAAIGRGIDDLDEARVEDVQAGEMLTGPVKRFARVHHAALDRQRGHDQRQRFGDVPARGVLFVDLRRGRQRGRRRSESGRRDGLRTGGGGARHGGTPVVGRMR